MTQLELARECTSSPAMRAIAEKEGLDPELVRSGVADGSIVIPANVNHKGVEPLGIGRGLRTKVNANIGTSSDYGDVNTELEKLQAAASWRSCKRRPLARLTR